MQQYSHLTDGNIAYIEALYDQYLKDPNSLDNYWREQFDQLSHSTSVNGHGRDVVLSDIRNNFLNYAKQPKTYANGEVSTTPRLRQAKVMQLINAYRWHGHHHAKLDPLELAERRHIPDLAIEFHQLSRDDLNTAFTNNTHFAKSGKTLNEIYEELNKTYCHHIGIEYMHITNPEETQWIQDHFEAVRATPTYSKAEKVKILESLIAAEGLEKYLGARYVGQKRFSLEGAVSLIPMLDDIVSRAGAFGVEELIMGMAHRGRLNVLVNVLGKSPEKLFKEFEGHHSTDIETYSGDVKYHLGYSSDVNTPNGHLHLALAFNPSHLEIIDPVVVGAVRARQDRRGNHAKNQVVPLLIHGDAAFAGQGVVMETFTLSQARGFNVGGTVHIVVNNQIGFTTSNPLDARSSLYCTDIAKMVQAPIFHVNGDDAEACVFATRLAFEYRMRFKKDVVIDLVCYRRHGHNEADEPAMTQPIMYRKIRQHSRSREIYSNQLLHEKVITQAEVDAMLESYRARLEKGKALVEMIAKEDRSEYLANWSPYKSQQWYADINTGVDVKRLQNLAIKLTTLPEGYHLQNQVNREIEARKKMAIGELPVNWGFAESLAYASLLTEGWPVRFCGQDSGRGTFTHRHAVLYDSETGQSYVPLKHLAANQALFTMIDSALSEEGVLGFEYGYATTDPESLVIWEAQFGDFFNGAQVVIDQFISSGEQKWGRLCGLTMFLPHGYEGQGPEHTSARQERFLQLSAQKNIQVCVPTTPAQLFHMLRRQMLRKYRKPLIVFTPKSLLRFKLTFSAFEELVEGHFQNVIPEIDTQDKTKVKRVILCTGKVYYDLLQARRKAEIDDIAIARV
ncbi:MAG: 2-oxoglutarate dehydrogenase E1 component, partial [Pseudomonadota bacterium]